MKKPDLIRPCPQCGEPKSLRATCKSQKCLDARVCIGCGISRKGDPTDGPRCISCYRDYKNLYAKKHKNELVEKGIQPRQKPQAIVKTWHCKQCPSYDKWARCGAVISGEHAGKAAIAVRLSGACPRRHGVRDVLDRWCARKNNLHAEPLDSHRRTVGKPGPYVDEVRCYE